MQPTVRVTVFVTLESQLVQRPRLTDHHGSVRPAINDPIKHARESVHDGKRALAPKTHPGNFARDAGLSGSGLLL
jgi:hypothetical protein